MSRPTESTQVKLCDFGASQEVTPESCIDLQCGTLIFKLPYNDGDAIYQESKKKPHLLDLFALLLSLCYWYVHIYLSVHISVAALLVNFVCYF